MVYVLGFDPGFRHTGWALVRSEPEAILDGGVLVAPECRDPKAQKQRHVQQVATAMGVALAGVRERPAVVEAETGVLRVAVEHFTPYRRQVDPSAGFRTAWIEGVILGFWGKVGYPVTLVRAQESRKLVLGSKADNEAAGNEEERDKEAVVAALAHRLKDAPWDRLGLGKTKRPHVADAAAAALVALARDW